MTKATIMVRTKAILETGEWWTIQWWQDDKYYLDGFASRESVTTAFSELIRVFDANWMLGQKINGIPPFLHPIALHLMGEGNSYFQFFYKLGINLHDVRSKGLTGDIERRLKNPREYWESGAFELKFLSILTRAGYEVERNHPSGIGRHNCEFKCSLGSETVFIEIKRPREFSKRNQETINRSSIQAIHQVVNGDNLYTADNTPHRLSSKSEIEKVFKLIRHAGSKQISESGPGIVIVESPHAMNWSGFEVSANRRFNGRKKYSAISAIVLIRASFEEGRMCCNSKILHNPQANTNLESSIIMELFGNTSF